MAKRISMKGKGAAIFFGDYPTEPTTDTTSVQRPASMASESVPSTRSPFAAPSSPPPILFRADDDPTVTPPGRPSNRPLDRPSGRTITRYSFEYYQDQINRLKSLALQAKLRGEKGSMSEMVRTAIDTYLSALDLTAE